MKSHLIFLLTRKRTLLLFGSWADLWALLIDGLMDECIGGGNCCCCCCKCEWCIDCCEGCTCGGTCCCVVPADCWIPPACCWLATAGFCEYLSSQDAIEFVVGGPPSAKCEFFWLHIEQICTIPCNVMGLAFGGAFIFFING